MLIYTIAVPKDPKIDLRHFQMNLYYIELKGSKFFLQKEINFTVVLACKIKKKYWRRTAFKIICTKFKFFNEILFYYNSFCLLFYQIFNYLFCFFFCKKYSSCISHFLLLKLQKLLHFFFAESVLIFKL